MLIPANAAMNMHSLDITDKDLAPICSGNGEIKWIKLSEFYQTGKINFLEQVPVSETNEQSDTSNNGSCSICSVYNELDNHAIELIANSIVIDGLLSEDAISALKYFTKRSALNPSSRDPPSLT